jgi:hypothetical protein
MVLADDHTALTTPQAGQGRAEQCLSPGRLTRLGLFSCALAGVLSSPSLTPAFLSTRVSTTGSDNSAAGTWMKLSEVEHERSQEVGT